MSHSVARLLLKRVPRHFAVSSHDLQFLDFLKNRDPLQARYLSLQWVSALKQWINHFMHLAPVQYVPLVIQGKQDETVDWQYNIPVVKNKFPAAKVLYLKEGRHQLVNESEEIREPMFAAMDVYFDVFNVT